MQKEIDARGLACPAPVLKIKDSIEQENPDIIKVIVDNKAAKENVVRFLGFQEFEVFVEQDGEIYRITGRKKENGISREAVLRPEKTGSVQKKIIVMVATDRIGHGDDELGVKLMSSFLKTLKEMGNELWRLIFLNNGVKLTIDDSAVLQVLKDLEKDGLHILVCGTCLTHFNLLDQKCVGDTTNMLDIVTGMQLADVVINI